MAFRPDREPPARLSVTARTESAREILKANSKWLRARWQAAFDAQAQGAPLPVPAWFYEPPTGPLVQAIFEAGLEVPVGANRGQMRDLADLFAAPGGELEDILAFFGVRLPAACRNRARARHEATRLLSDPARMAAWRGRLSVQLQHEFHRRMGRERPAGESFWAVHASMEAVLRTVPGHVRQQWTALATIAWDFDRAAFLQARRLARPRLDELLQAVRALRAHGVDWHRLDAATVASYMRAALPASTEKKGKGS